MGSHAAHSSEGLESASVIDDIPRQVSLLCPICGDSFAPRTSTQTICTLKCFAELSRKKGVYRDYTQ
jgi:hypothetical protein